MPEPTKEEMDAAFDGIVKDCGGEPMIKLMLKKEGVVIVSNVPNKNAIAIALMAAAQKVIMADDDAIVRVEKTSMTS